MDYFGINSADDLPRIKEVLAEQVVEPTIIKDVELKNDDETESATNESPLKNGEEGGEDVMLSVSEDGELVDKAEDSN